MSPSSGVIDLARSLIEDPRRVSEVLARLDAPQVQHAERVELVLALAIAGVAGVELDAAVFEILDDDLLVDALLAADASAALTGLIVAGGARVSPATRRYLAVRITSASPVGTHVAALQLAIGDTTAAARSAAAATIAATRQWPADGPEILALAHLLSRWVEAHGEVFARVFSAQLPDAPRIALLSAIRQIDARTDLPLVRALETAG